VWLEDPVSKDVLVICGNHHILGANYEVGGSNELFLSITQNYRPIFVEVFGLDGIRFLYGKSGAETIPLLKTAISKLRDDPVDDYWKCTQGNVKRVLYSLLSFAQMRPDGIWCGD